MYNSVMLLFSSNTIYIVMMCCILTVLILANEMSFKGSKLKNVKISENKKKAPGPAKKFFIGNLDLLDGYETPFQAFGILAKKYGDVFSLQLGSVPTLVVNGYENIKEVLLTKGDKFDARPNFQRFNMLFGGDKENSLAFCDWSEMQKTRRDLLTSHSFPRKFSFNYNRFNNISMSNIHQLSHDLKATNGNEVFIKPFISETCLQVFLEYFSSRTFEKTNKNFRSIMDNFDKVFWEVNQGYACDFLPILMPFYNRKQKEMTQCSHTIRSMINESIIGDRFATWSEGNEVNDYIDSMIDHVKCQSTSSGMNWDTALYAIEDMIGGHSAVGNFVVKTLAFLVKHPEVQKEIQSEVDQLLNGRDLKDITVNDRTELIYTEAAILESLRLISSPVVPHVASDDSTISGYSVEKGTLVFLNNHELNMSPSLWEEPENYQPNRFISNGRISKPEHFIPFGFGRRSCMGYKIVHMLSFTIIANILKDFNLIPVNDKEIKIAAGSLAVKNETYKFSIVSRS